MTNDEKNLIGSELFAILKESTGSDPVFLLVALPDGERTAPEFISNADPALAIEAMRQLVQAADANN